MSWGRKRPLSRKRAAWEAAVSARSAPADAQNRAEVESKGKPLVPARKTVYNGARYDSAFEAFVAEQLDWLVLSGDIKAVERQYVIELTPYNMLGEPIAQLKRHHRVDFRTEHHDGTFTLVEAKGFPTPAYKQVAKWVNYFWLPAHPDHSYAVVYAGESVLHKLSKRRDGRPPCSGA